MATCTHQTTNHRENVCDCCSPFCWMGMDIVPVVCRVRRLLVHSYTTRTWFWCGVFRWGPGDLLGYNNRGRWTSAGQREDNRYRCKSKKSKMKCWGLVNCGRCPLSSCLPSFVVDILPPLLLLLSLMLMFVSFVCRAIFCVFLGGGEGGAWGYLGASWSREIS